jgi:hypothetical protein
MEHNVFLGYPALYRVPMGNPIIPNRQPRGLLPYDIFSYEPYGVVIRSVRQVRKPVERKQNSSIMEVCKNGKYYNGVHARYGSSRSATCDVCNTKELSEHYNIGDVDVCVSCRTKLLS